MSLLIFVGQCPMSIEYMQPHLHERLTPIFGTIDILMVHMRDGGPVGLHLR